MIILVYFAYFSITIYVVGTLNKCLIFLWTTGENYATFIIKCFSLTTGLHVM